MNKYGLAAILFFIATPLLGELYQVLDVPRMRAVLKVKAEQVVVSAEKTKVDKDIKDGKITCTATPDISKYTATVTATVTYTETPEVEPDKTKDPKGIKEVKP